MQKSMVIAMATAALFGCGTCATCDEKKPGDDIPSALPATTAAPLTSKPVPSASASASAEEAGADAASPEAAPPTPAFTLTVKPPMPMGSLQSCGVYDGPLCKKDCPAGNCRQDCDGVDCELTCPGGYCRQLCGASGTCRLSCKGGHCLQVCTKNEGCARDCAGGDCEAR